MLRERPIPPSPDDTLEAQLQIPKSSVITGTVFDEHGEPAPQVPVRAMRIQVQNGERTSVENISLTDAGGGVLMLNQLFPRVVNHRVDYQPNGWETNSGV